MSVYKCTCRYVCLLGAIIYFGHDSHDKRILSCRKAIKGIQKSLNQRFIVFQASLSIGWKVKESHEIVGRLMCGNDRALLEFYVIFFV